MEGGGVHQRRPSAMEELSQGREGICDDTGDGYGNGGDL